MPPDHRKKTSARRPAPNFDLLEERALLTASMSTTVHLVPAHAQPMHHAALAPATHSPSTVHAAVSAHSVAKPFHAAAKHIRATPHTAVKKAPAAHVAPTRLLPTRAMIGPRAHAYADGSDVVPSVTQASPVAGALNPTQVRTAYGVNLLPNQGQGVTIDIIDVYHVPTVANDLSVFSSQFGLPQLDGLNGDPTFTIVSQPGTPVSPVAASGVNSTGLETMLDVEWAHAMAPYANIILQEVSSFQYNDGAGGGLLPGVHNAASTPGVVAVSVSYGSTEFSSQTGYEPLLSPVAGNPNAIAFSTGDDGYPGFPATSPSVLAVGGTGLYLASARGRYGFETAWGNLSGQRAGGGGVSAYYGAPTFQSSNGVSFNGRAIPDVSAVGDLLTLVSVYDSYDASYYGSPWIGVYGTSVAAPIVSGMISLAQQNRINSGLLPLTSPQINARLYAAYNSPGYSTYFHDIIVGNNSERSGTTGAVTYTGFNATTGYDRATGLGSPIANQFVALLSAP